MQQMGVAGGGLSEALKWSRSRGMAGKGSPLPAQGPQCGGGVTSTACLLPPPFVLKRPRLQCRFLIGGVEGRYRWQPHVCDWLLINGNGV